MSNAVLLLDHFATRLEGDFKLMRLVEWAGFALRDFQRGCIGPDDPTPWLNRTAPPSVVVVPMGPAAISGLGLPGSVLDIRGYVTGGPGHASAIPTVSPGYIQRGNSRWSAAFIADLQKAVELSRSGLPAQFVDYGLDPRPDFALAWAKDYLTALAADPGLYLAFDIETPGKGNDEEDLDADGDAPDRTWRIERIGFSYRGLHGISFPWAPEYLAAVRLLLGSAGAKVVWNAGFDVPRLRRAGIHIAGIIHDGMVAWHVLHSDLPKSLKFVATFTCPWQPAWKHLSGARPAFYNCTDADVELRSMLRIEQDLRQGQLWDVYERDVVQLEPILAHMTARGMPLDAEVRADRARRLAERLAATREEMEAAVPMEARRIAHVYKEPPQSISGLHSRPGTRVVPVCVACGARRPRKDHFRVLKKKVNPCAAAGTRESEVRVDEYYRLADFTPSRDQLTRYHHFLRRPLPMVFDKKLRARKVSFAERQLKDLGGKYPLDKLYPAILQYRQLDKIAGTYIGRVVE